MATRALGLILLSLGYILSLLPASAAYPAQPQPQIGTADWDINTKTYSVDQSCYNAFGRSQFDHIVGETFHMARRAAQRTWDAFDGMDDDFARVFHLVMKSDVWDNTGYRQSPVYDAMWYPNRRAHETAGNETVREWVMCELPPALRQSQSDALTAASVHGHGRMGLGPARPERRRANLLRQQRVAASPCCRTSLT